jgi:hypothetical protein
MQYLRYASAGLVILSLLGGGYLFQSYSKDLSSASDPTFQAIGIISSLLFISGIALAFISKPKKIQKEMPAQQPEIKPLGVSTSELQILKQAVELIEREQKVIKQEPIIVPELSFEEDMALRKKRYYEEMNG